MGDPLQPYRDAVVARIHAVCLDRNLDPQSQVNTELGCRIERFLPRLIDIAKHVSPKDPVTFEETCLRTVCVECGNQDARGRCPIRSQAECCLYRYLPLVYDAIHSVGPRHVH